MTELRPQMSAIGCATGDQGMDRLSIATRSEHEISRFLRVARISLHFTDDRQGGPAVRPSLVQPSLGFRGITLTATKRIRHRRLCETILENGAAGKVQRATENVTRR